MISNHSCFPSGTTPSTKWAKVIELTFTRITTFLIGMRSRKNQSLDNSDLNVIGGGEGGGVGVLMWGLL